MGTYSLRQSVLHSAHQPACIGKDPVPAAPVYKCAGACHTNFPSMDDLSCRPAPHQVTLRRHGETQTLFVGDILFAEIFDHELQIHAIDGQTYCGRGHLCSLQKQLPSHMFLRCHKSYLVNLCYVIGLCRYRITLVTGVSIPVSKQNYLAIQRTLSTFALGPEASHS